MFRLETYYTISVFQLNKATLSREWDHLIIIPIKLEHSQQPADLCVVFQSFSLTDRLFEIKKEKYWIWIFPEIAAIQSFQLLQPRVEQRTQRQIISVYKQQKNKKIST